LWPDGGTCDCLINGGLAIWRQGSLTPKKLIGDVSLILPTHNASAMQQNNTTNSTADAVENADVWALARNQIYCNMQQKLNETTAERDVFR